MSDDAPDGITPAPSEGKMDIMTALQTVLKKALAHDGLRRGFHEVIKTIEQGKAQLVVLSQNCDNPDMTKLIEALCHEKDVNLLTVPESKKLGEWAGLCKLDAEGTPRKVVGASCVCVSDFGEESSALTVVKESLAKA